MFGVKVLEAHKLLKSIGEQAPEQVTSSLGFGATGHTSTFVTMTDEFGTSVGVIPSSLAPKLEELLKVATYKSPKYVSC